MKELSLFKSLDTCSAVTNMLLTVITTPPTPQPIVLIFQTSPFCSVCSLTLLNPTCSLVVFVTLHLWCYICILRALPRSRNWSNVLWAFIIYTTWPIFRGLEGGTSISTPSPPLHFTSPNAAGKIIANYFWFGDHTTGVVLKEGLLDELSLIIHFI